MIKLSVAIMTHPSRADRLPKLLAQFEPFTQVHIELDTEDAGPWPTAKRCWEKTPDTASHRMIVQDDVILCKDFYISAVRAIRHLPRSPVGFYANHKAIEHARAKGHSWARFRGNHRMNGIWGQIQCIPAALVKPFLAWQDKEKHNDPHLDNPKWDDWILGQYLKSQKIVTYATVPSLVEHDCPSDSLIGCGNKNKVARWFIGEDVSGLTINWRKGL